MTLRYLVDTNILSEPIKPVRDPAVIDRLRYFRPEMATAAPVWHELLNGYYRMAESTRRLALEDYLFHVVARDITILPYDDRAAEWHATERVRLERIGRTPPFIDSQIAAVAFVNGLALVTANVSDFSGFLGLRVENWRTT